MISMRYARNLAHGYGLVWNPGGERVEGYTNPLWVVYMSIFHLFPIPASKISLFIQISGAIFLIANLFFVKKIAERLSGSSIVAILAVILTAFYSPLNNWGLQGMEVSVLTLMTSTSLWIALENLRLNRFTPWLYLLLGVSTLIRTDMAVPFIVILGVLAIADRQHRRQNLIWGVGMLAAFLAGQTLFRLVYYSYPLPNTYYLKLGGYPFYKRVAHGLYVLSQFIWEFNWVLFLLPLSILLFRRDFLIYLLFLVFLGQIAYSVYVGGDAWEHRGGSNRYFSIVMPVFFILFTYAANLIRRTFVEKIRHISRLAQPAANLGLALFVLAGMVNFNFFLNTKSLERWILLRQPIFIEGNKEYVSIARDINKTTSPNASIAVVAAGAIPYFTDRYSLDLLGKNDVFIAHENVHGGGGLASVKNFRPGHMKWDYDYSIGKLKPDVVVQLWGNTEEAKAYINKYYKIGGAGDGLDFSYRAGSPNVLWDKVILTP
jgi:arabinofuranosyltransferase